METCWTQLRRISGKNSNESRSCDLRYLAGSYLTVSRVKPPNGLEPPSSSIGNAAEDSNRLEYDSASITSTSKAEGTSTIEVSQTRIPDRILVVAKQRSENTSWIDENFPE